MRFQKLAKHSSRSGPPSSVRLDWLTGVSNLLRDEAEFPALAAFLRDFDDTEGEFRVRSGIDKSYEEVKSVLRRNAGARGPRRTS